MLKVCVKCKENKSLDDFPRNKGRKDGLGDYCKSCNSYYFNRYAQSSKGRKALKRAYFKLEKTGYYLYGKGAITNLRTSAKNRGLKCELTADELQSWWLLTEDRCFYCDMTLAEYLGIRDFLLKYRGNNTEIVKFKAAFTYRQARIKRMTIDRVDNMLGYTINNIVKACWFCNFVKGRILTKEDMLIVGKNVIQRLKNEIDLDYAIHWKKGVLHKK